MRNVGFGLIASLGAFPTSGCIFGTGGGGGNDDDSGADTGGTDDGMTTAGSAGTGSTEPDPSELDACRGDASDVEVEDTVVIVDDYNQSLHEMVACGGLAVSLCAAIIDGVIDAIVAKVNDATPDGWQYQGDGVYFTDSAMAGMQMRFYLAEDLEYGPAGTLVTHNLFLVDSYLVNGVIEIDFATGKAQIVYDEPGPLVELMGFGANPPNPLPVDINDLAALKSKLRKLEFEGTVAVDDTQSVSTIRYDLDIPRMSAGALLDGLGMAYELKMASATRADLEQSLVVDSWDVDFVDQSPGALQGSVQFHVDGQYFPFAGILRWDDDTYGRPQLLCP